MICDGDAGQPGVRLVDGSAAVSLLELFEVSARCRRPLRRLGERLQREPTVMRALGLENVSVIVGGIRHDTYFRRRTAACCLFR